MSDGLVHQGGGSYLTGDVIPISYLQEDENDGEDLAYTLKNDYTMLTVRFAYNTTAYGNVTNAFNNNALETIFNQDWDDRNTSFNAFSFVGTLLTFNIPAPYPFNYILAAPILAAIVYMLFIFALRLVGAVFGGGGA